jgi:ankyrin repeat protein
VNAKDSDGNTPLHLAVITLNLLPGNQFDKIRLVMKELLFSGADRDAKNLMGKSPIDLLDDCKLSENDFSKMHYILSKPKGLSFLRTT